MIPLFFFVTRPLLVAVPLPPPHRRTILTQLPSSLVQELPPLESQDLVPELDPSLVPSSSDMPVTPHWNSNFFHTPSWVSPCLKLWVFSVLWWPFCCCLLSKLCFPNIQNIYQFLSSSRFSAEKKECNIRKKYENRKDNFDPCYIGLENSAEFNILGCKATFWVEPSVLLNPRQTLTNSHTHTWSILLFAEEKVQKAYSVLFRYQYHRININGTVFFSA